jgi:hypothetical protein
MNAYVSIITILYRQHCGWHWVWSYTFLTFINAPAINACNTGIIVIIPFK